MSQTSSLHAPLAGARFPMNEGELRELSHHRWADNVMQSSSRGCAPPQCTVSSFPMSKSHMIFMDPLVQLGDCAPLCSLPVPRCPRRQGQPPSSPLLLAVNDELGLHDVWSVTKESYLVRRHEEMLAQGEAGAHVEALQQVSQVLVDLRREYQRRLISSSDVRDNANTLHPWFSAKSDRHLSTRGADSHQALREYREGVLASLARLGERHLSMVSTYLLEVEGLPMPTKLMVKVLSSPAHMLKSGWEMSLREFQDWVRAAMEERGDMLPTVEWITRMANLRLGPYGSRSVRDVLLQYGGSGAIEGDTRAGGAQPGFADDPAVVEEIIKAVLSLPSAPARPTQLRGKYVQDTLQSLLLLESRSVAESPPPREPSDAFTMDRESSVEWAFVLAARTKSTPETFFLTVALVDRYITEATERIPMHRIFILAAFWIAAKYEEIYAPTAENLMELGNCGHMVAELVSSERHLYMQLGCNLTVATSHAIAQAITAEQDPPPTPQQESVIYFVLVIIAMKASFVKYRQSVVAAAAVYISRKWTGIPTGRPNALVSEMVCFAVDAIKAVIRDGGRSNAVLRYFASDDCYEVSTAATRVDLDVLKRELGA